MINPYRVGSWVVGDDFYNRDELLQEILEGSVNGLWIIGNRRVGKTSLLKAAEYQATDSTQYLPLFWDMQGDTSETQLIESFLEAIEYARSSEINKRWQKIDLPENATKINHALRYVAEQAREQHCQLLLLCDEIEGLNQLGEQEPHILSKLRRVMQHNPAIRTILTSTRRLSRLYAIQQQQDTSLFLEGFEPRYLAGFDDDTARQVICRTQSQRPLAINEKLTQIICAFSGNHPLILQKICSQLFDPETGTFRPFDKNEFTLDDQLISTFQQDFDSLSPDEAQVLLYINTQVSSLDKISQAFSEISKHRLRHILRDLTQLGFLRRIDGSYKIGNELLGQWLKSGPTHQTHGGITNRMAYEVSQERLISLQRQLITYTRRLEHLEVLQAKQASEITEIELYRNRIGNIEAELTELGEVIEFPVFIGYSHKDEALKNDLLSHLGILQKEGLIDLWSDDQIEPGVDREIAITQAISQARVAVLLISANFLTSDFVRGTIVPSLLQRRNDEGLIVFPIIATACAWQAVEWLAAMKVRPKTGQPVWGKQQSHVDEYLANIAEEIAKIAKRGF